VATLPAWTAGMTAFMMVAAHAVGVQVADQAVSPGIGDRGRRRPPRRLEKKLSAQLSDCGGS